MKTRRRFDGFSVKFASMFVLANQPSIANQFIAELRDQSIQQDRMRFRTNLARLGEILAYEISKNLEYEEKKVKTPLGTAKVALPVSQPVLVAVLRAAVPFYQGFLQIFDQAESGFIGAFRKEDVGSDISVELGYHASPSIEGKTIIITDPMLATGKSVVQTIETLLTHGTPKTIHIAAAFAAPEGIEYLNSQLTIPHQFWLGALDEKLNHLSYILPGLGDAGDLAFGTKL